MIQAPTRSVSFLRSRMRPLALDPRIAKLVVELDDEQFAVRERAAVQLEAQHDLAEPALRKAVARKPSLEARRRMTQLLDKLEGPVGLPGHLQFLRALEVLENVATPEARDLLQTLADGAPEARLTQEAKASLDRLTKRAAAKP